MNHERALGVYVHWPYCARICPYCDFNVYKNQTIDEAAWIGALSRDLDLWAAHTKDRKLTSLYFGGGTPSLAPLSIIEHVIDMCAEKWGLAPDAEITLEANPTDAEQRLFSDFAKAGVNRLSLGVQSLRDEALAFLGRDHSAAEARGAIETAQNTFAQTTFDLIYARRGQSLEGWRAELAEALAMGASHLSLYQLTIEPGTAFAVQTNSGRWAPPGDEICADQFDLAQEMTAAAGLPAYEISNHARKEARSRHNMLYWTYQDYIGVGPGAHGRLVIDGQRHATQTALRPGDYLAPTTMPEITPLTEQEQIIERFSFGLRLHDGMALTRNDPFFTQEDAEAKLRSLMDSGLLSWKGATLKASADGRRLLNTVLTALI